MPAPALHLLLCKPQTPAVLSYAGLTAKPKFSGIVRNFWRAIPSNTVHINSILENHMDKHIQDQADHSNMVKDPKDWTTGDEPMTGAQKSYLKTLSEEAGVEMDETLSKAEASKRIDALQHKTGRGLEETK